MKTDFFLNLLWSILYTASIGVVLWTITQAQAMWVQGFLLAYAAFLALLLYRQAKYTQDDYRKWREGK